MTVTLYLRENVTSQLTALYASIEGNSEYDQGRKQGILLVATALDIHPAHIIAAANLPGLPQGSHRGFIVVRRHIPVGERLCQQPGRSSRQG